MCCVIQRAILFLFIAKAISYPISNENPLLKEEEKSSIFRTSSDLNTDLLATEDINLDAAAQDKTGYTKTEPQPGSIQKLEDDEQIVSTSLKLNVDNTPQVVASEVEIKPESEYQKISVNADVGAIKFDNGIKEIKLIPNTDVTELHKHDFAAVKEHKIIIDSTRVNQQLPQDGRQSEIVIADAKQSQPPVNSKIIFEDTPHIEEEYQNADNKDQSNTNVDENFLAIKNFAPISLDDLLEDNENTESNDEVLKNVDETAENSLPLEVHNDNTFTFNTKNFNPVVENDQLNSFNENGNEPLERPTILVEENSFNNNEFDEHYKPVSNEQSSVIVDEDEPTEERPQNSKGESIITNNIREEDFIINSQTPLEHSESISPSEDVNMGDLLTNLETIMISQPEDNEQILPPIVEETPYILPIKPIAETNSDLLRLEPIAEAPIEQSSGGEPLMLSIKPMKNKLANIIPTETIGENSNIFSIKPIANQRPNTFSKEPMAGENINLFPIQPVAVESPDMVPITSAEENLSSFLNPLPNLIPPLIYKHILKESDKETLHIDEVNEQDSMGIITPVEPESNQEQIKLDSVQISGENLKTQTSQTISDTQKDRNEEISTSNINKDLNINSLGDLLASMDENDPVITNDETPSFGIFINTKKEPEIEIHTDHKPLDLSNPEQPNTKNTFHSSSGNTNEGLTPFNPFSFYPLHMRRRYRPLRNKHIVPQEHNLKKVISETKVGSGAEKPTKTSSEPAYSTADIFKALIKSLRQISTIDSEQNETLVSSTKFDSKTPIIIILNLPKEENESKGNKLKPEVKMQTRKKISESLLPHHKSPSIMKPMFSKKPHTPQFRPSLRPLRYDLNPYYHRHYYDPYHNINQYSGFNERKYPKHYYKFSYMPTRGFPYLRKKSFEPSKPIVFPNHQYH